MKEQLKLLIKDRLLLTTFLLCTAFLLFELVLIAINQASLPPLVPLLYQQAWGVKQLVHKEFLFILPVISSLFMAANIIFAALLYQKAPLISRMFFGSSLFVCILSMISSLRIIFLIL